MIDINWPLGFLERPSTDVELLGCGSDKLARWLRLSILSWVTAAKPELRTRAFSPLTFSVNDDADRQLAAWGSAAPAAFRLQFENAIAQTIETMSLTQDLPAAALALNIGARFGCPDPLVSVTAVLSKPITGRGRDVLARSISHFGIQRLQPKQCRDLAYAIKHATLIYPESFIELLAQATISYGVSILGDMRELLPMLFDEGPGPDAYKNSVQLRRFWANVIVDVLSPVGAMRFVIDAQRKDAPELREAVELYRLKINKPLMRDMNHVVLSDRVTLRRYRVDLSDLEPGDLSVEGGLAASKQRFDRDDIDTRLGMPRVETPE